MTLRLERLLTRIRALSQHSEERQDHIAERLGIELDRLSGASDDTPVEFSEAESRHWLGGRKPSREEIRQAVRGLRTMRTGLTLGPDLSIRSMIDQGRR